MAYVFYNPNPKKKLVGDCVIRGISKLTDQSWNETYVDLCLQGYMMNDMPSSNAVWGTYLYENGYRQHVISDTCPNCYTVKRFCAEHPTGKYLLATGTHTICVDSGKYWDSWDSGDETVSSYWTKGV